MSFRRSSTSFRLILPELPSSIQSLCGCCDTTKRAQVGASKQYRSSIQTFLYRRRGRLSTWFIHEIIAGWMSWSLYCRCESASGLGGERPCNVFAFVIARSGVLDSVVLGRAAVAPSRYREFPRFADGCSIRPPVAHSRGCSRWTLFARLKVVLQLHQRFFAMTLE